MVTEEVRGRLVPFVSAARQEGIPAPQCDSSNSAPPRRARVNGPDVAGDCLAAGRATDPDSAFCLGDVGRLAGATMGHGQIGEGEFKGDLTTQTRF